MGRRRWFFTICRIMSLPTRRSGSRRWKRAVSRVMDQLADMRDRLAGEGIQCRMLTGGGTGTYDIDAEKAVLTELQGGSYIFMDREYNEVAGAFPFQTSLFVQMTVISNNTP